MLPQLPIEAAGQAEQESHTHDGKRSLFGEILDWMLVPLIIGWPLSITITYFVAQSIANHPYDRQLRERADWLSRQLTVNHGLISVALPPMSSEYLGADEFDEVRYVVRRKSGEWLHGDANLPGLRQPGSDPEKTSFEDLELNGKPYRLAYRWIKPEGGTEPAFVMVAETSFKRKKLADDIVRGVIVPQFVILPISVLLVWFGLSRGISPLSVLRQRMRRRDPQDLSPIDTDAVPEELEPFILSINELLLRITHLVQSQKRFIADAAHQLKTPLAGLTMQSELALRLQDPEELRNSMRQLLTSTERATRLINQLLSLNRVEFQIWSNHGVHSEIDLVPIAREVLSDLAVLAIDKGIDLGFEPVPEKAVIRGNRVSLPELIRNLLDNAIHYTPNQGRVTLSIEPDGDVWVLAVEDTGPGIAKEFREQIFEPFVRLSESSQNPGSGLGLAIVKEIAKQHQSQVEVSTVSPQGGSRFVVRFAALKSTT